MGPPAILKPQGIKMMLKPLAVAALTIGLTGCGVAYISPSVTQETTEAGLKVRVVPMTAETVMVANRSLYTPKMIPAAFRSSAVAGLSRPDAVEPPAPVFNAIDAPPPKMLRAPPPIADAPYRIGVGDVLLFASPAGGTTVEQLTGILAAQTARQGFTVQDDGAIAIPNAGRVVLADMTLDEAEDTLFTRLVEAGMEPAFSLEVSEFNSKRVTLGGAVRQPGVLPVTLTPLGLNEALQLSGGVSVAAPEFATIRIYREGSLFQIPLENYRNDPNLQRTRLQANDAVFVDTTYDLDRAQAFFQEQILLTNFRQSARAQAVAQLQSEISLRQTEISEAQARFDRSLQLGAVDMDYVYLAGEVGTQTRVSLPFEQTASLADVLYGDGGGFQTQQGNPRHIYVLRGASDVRDFAGLTAYNLDASNAANLLLATRFELRPNDVIFIAEQPVTRWNRAISLIIPSFVVNATGLN